MLAGDLGAAKQGPVRFDVNLIIMLRAAGYHWRAVPGERHEEIYMLKDRPLFAGREEAWGGWGEAGVV